MNTTITEKYRKMINESCIGYSTDIHWSFFKQILNNPEIKDICILGVYYGRDIAYIASILKSLGNRNYKIFGVDKFEDSSGNDWPEETRSLTWEKAGFGFAPDIIKTRDNLTKLGLDENVFLYQNLAENFLKSTEQLFDFIYIDLSHDYETTVNAIQLAINKIKPGGVIGGDDFSNQGTWGVVSAVQDSFSKYEVINNWIWLANPGDFIFKNLTQDTI